MMRLFQSLQWLRRAAWLAGLMFLLGGCAMPAFYPPGSNGPTPTPSESDLRASAEVTAQTFLALALGITTDNVYTVSVEPVEWPSACLGLSRPGLPCAPEPTPGYRFVLEAQGRRFEYHTNADGSAYEPIDPVYEPRSPFWRPKMYWQANC
jgi:hypothetical protein